MQEMENVIKLLYFLLKTIANISTICRDDLV